MKKWVIFASAYLIVVVVGYYLFDHFNSKNSEAMNVQEDEMHTNLDSHIDGTDHHGDEHSEENQHGHANNGSEISEVKPTIEYKDELLSIQLLDLSGNPVTELEVNHEKLLHLIIVDEHLEAYYHLHPEFKGEGRFEIATSLPKGSYKAFIDIKPKDLSYIVEPLELKVGEEDHAHRDEPLKLDTELTKTVNGHTITLNPVNFVTGNHITLDFDIPNVQIEPYLGALGHVVILDEHAEKYIHVHPHENDTVFETEFDRPDRKSVV